MSGTSSDNSQRARLQDAIRSIRRLQKRVAELEGASSEPIAIVGIGCRLPGDVSDPEEYWRLLDDGVDAISEVPPDRWDGPAFYDPDPEVPGKMYTLAGGFVDGLDRFDADLFKLSPREVAKIDPQHRLVLEVAWEALEHAGVPPKSLKESSTGVYLGITAFDYGLHLSHVGDSIIDAYSMTGTKLNFAAGRLSYVLGLQGPALSVDTACSSSLVAIHLACQALRREECEMALAGGVNAMLTPEQTVAECKARMLSPEGRCKTFDASADGFVRGEGCGMLVLEKLSRAKELRHPVIAVIRGSAVNQDGPTSGPTVPNRIAQEAVIRLALKDAGLHADDIDYVEAHGTGTPLGDPIEVRALANVFGGSDGRAAPLKIGSVKTNFGHLESAAGVAGLMKVALGLAHEAIPPHLHVNKLTPAVDWSSIPIQVATERDAWPASSRTRRAGVSSFGASGTNAHIILEEWRAEPIEASRADRPSSLYCLSAETADSLTELAHRREQALEVLEAEQLVDACFTVTAGRSHFQHRLAVIGEDIADVTKGLATFGRGELSPAVIAGTGARNPRVAFLFSGRLGKAAGRELYASVQGFRDCIDQCAEILDPRFDKPLQDVLFGDAADERQRPSHAEPSLVALQYALASVWRSWGTVPSALFGYGSGEYAAACVSGALSLEDALLLAHAKGIALESIAEQGAMAAVSAPASQVSETLADYPNVSIAAINGPDRVVLSGAAEELERSLQDLEERGIATCKLDVAYAPHSPLVERHLADLAPADGIDAASPRVHLVSGLSGELLSPTDTLGLDHWRKQVREPVQFDKALQTLIDDDIDAFVEIGPDATLTRMARGLAEGRQALWVNSLEDGTDDWRPMTRALARLYVSGATVNWRAVHDADTTGMLRLPVYAFDRKRHWIDAPPPVPADALRAGAAAIETGHPLLGHRIRSPLKAVQFESAISVESEPWLADHEVFGRVVVPATAYLEMLIAAARQTTSDGFGIEDVFIHAPIVAEPGTTLSVQTIVEAGGESRRVRIASPDDTTADDNWNEHVTAQIRALPGAADEKPLDLDSIVGRCGDDVDISGHYEAMRKTGVAFGPAFRTVDRIRRGDQESVGWVSAPSGVGIGNDSAYWLHPAMLDGCLQVAREALPESVRENHDIALIPLRLAGLELFGAPGNTVVSHAILTSAKARDEMFELDVDIADEDGTRIACLRGLRLVRADRAALEAAAPTRSGGDIYELQWRKQPLESAAASAGQRVNWLIFAYEDPLLLACGEALRAAGDNVWSVAAGAEYELSIDGSTVAVDNAGDFRQLIEATVGSGQGPWTILHAGGSLTPGAELDAQTLHASQQSCLQSILHVAQALEKTAASDSRVAIVTRGSQRETTLAGLSGSPAWGLGRVMQTELPRLDTLLLDLGDDADAEQELIAEVRAGNAENQVVYRDGERFVARLVASDGALQTDSGRGAGMRRLTLETPGIPDSLAFRPEQRKAPGFGEVEIAVAAAGLNFRDVLVALGVYQGPAGPLGGECSGRVVAIGDGVSGMAPGDEVIAFATGAMASHVTTDARLTWGKPAALSDEEAAGVPIVFLTAAYCLESLGRMQKGDRVLIHGAAGGVGMAAVQLARRAGAEIFGTAGTPEKRQLIKSLGVNHALDSRSLDFADQILELTDGEGVDLVLNSLAGEFIPETLRVTKVGGRFVEIGRTDIWTAEQVEEFRPGTEYHTVLLGDVCEEDPAQIHELGERLFADIGSGALDAIPVQSWPMDDAAEAFRLMARAGHTGKLVLSNAGTAGQEASETPLARADGAYLVTGGFGGLGLELARWLVAEGAGQVALMGRSEPGEHAAAVIDELRGGGVDVLEIQGDVASDEDVTRALDAIAQTDKPLRGVVHAAGTLDDGVLPEQTWARFDGVLAAKMTGAWTLHRLTSECELDYFVLFSSASALLGAAGQGAYAAGNAFLDALARWRAQQGLGGLIIIWGPWAEVGMFVDAGEAGRRAVSERGFDMLSPSRSLAAMSTLIKAGSAGAAVLSVDWAAYSASQPGGRAPLLTSELTATVAPVDTGPESGAFVEELRAAPAARRRSLLQQKLREEVGAVLNKSAESIKTNQGFRELGMDSLMSVELRNRLERVLGCSLVSTLAFDHPTIEELGAYLLGDVLDVDRQTGTDTPQEGDDTDATADEFDESVAELSDEEAERMLMEELSKMREADTHG